MKTRVLVVEDEDLLREALGKLLERDGFDVLLAADGVEGLRALFTSSPPPDCVILDLLMPKIGGEDFLHVKNADPRTSDIPVVIFTAANIDPRSLEGATIYLSKPVGDTREISEAILRVIRHARATLPPETPR